MKILHTSDWHLGKKLNNICRLSQQQDVLNEIGQIACAHDVDVVLIAGDIFDTSVAPSSAESLLYKTLIELCDGAKRHVVVLGGNHDDQLRLSAPNPLAAHLNIHFVDTLKNIPLYIGGQKLNIACVPYIDLPRFTTQTKIKFAPDIAYSQKADVFIKYATADFSDDAVNVLCAHLMFSGAVTTDERELGTAVILPTDILPKADYIALGHIHKPTVVSKSKNAYYSGSLLPYHFGDNAMRQVNIVNISGGKTDVTYVPLKNTKPLAQFKTDNIDSALEYLKQNQNAYVQVIYSSNVPILASNYALLKSNENFVNLIIEAQKTQQKEVTQKSQKSPAELFSAFYLQQTNKQVSSALLDEFLKFIQ